MYFNPGTNRIVLQEWKPLLDLIVSIGGASAVVFGFWYWSKPKFEKLSRFLDVLQSFDTVQDDIKLIKEELSNNGGGSLKDAMVRTERKIEEVAKDLYLVRGVQRAMMNRTKIGFFETDQSGRLVWVSKYYLELTGKQLGDVLVNGWGSCIAPEDRQEVLNEWNDCVKNDRDFDMEYHIINGVGKVVPIKGHAKRVKTSDGQTMAFSGSIIEKDTEQAALTALFG
jgi:PAS domain S-box-containing protein